MARRWFQIVGEDGRALASADAVLLDVEDVAALRSEVKKQCPNTLATVDATDLVVFANRAAYAAKQRLPRSSTMLQGLGSDEDSALIVQAAMHIQKAVSEQSVPHPHPNRLWRWAALNKVFAQQKIANPTETSSDYTALRYDQVERILRTTPYQQEPKTIPDADIDVLYAYLLRVYNAFGAIVTGNQAKRLHFIAPILVCVSSLFGGEAQLLVEEIIEGKRLRAHCVFDFVIRRGTKLLCVIEAKRDNFKKGVAETLIGCEALADVEGLRRIFGVVTNYKEWVFLRSLDGRIERDEAEMQTTHGKPTRTSVKEIAEMIYAMLADDE